MLLARTLIAALIVALAVISVGSATAGPITYVVTRADDPAPDGCQPDDCSLREAVLDANANPGFDAIRIGALHIVLSITGSDDTGQKGDLDITESVTLSGVDPDNTIIDAGGIDRVIDIPSPQSGGDSSAELDISGVSITGGIHSGIHSSGPLSLDNVVVRANTNGSDSGGGIDAQFGGLQMDHTTIFKNSVTGGGKGGGIATHRATTLRTSTIFGNSAANGGGGIWSDGGLGLRDTTVTGNSAGSGLGGGGIYIESAPGSIIDSTIANNISMNPGGGIWNKNADVTLTNSIVANNTGAGKPDCDGTFTGDHNLIQTPAGCTLTGSGNITGQDPKLFPLASNGGPTQTLAIPKDSPARDGGASVCQATDQRGIPRAQGQSCDIGAYEYMFLGDMDCSGFVTTFDIVVYLKWLSVGKIPSCFYRGDLQCNLDFGTTDVLFLTRALANTGLPDPQPPASCGEIGPFEP